GVRQFRAHIAGRDADVYAGGASRPGPRRHLRLSAEQAGFAQSRHDSAAAGSRRQIATVMPMLRRLGGLGFVALLLGANPASAQTSSVAIVPESLPNGDVAATPVKPLELSDIDYPFDAMLANEEGEVTVALAIDSSGRVQNSRLAGLSRYQRLNEQSLRLARQRWQFQPATRN